jgi:hypothetical protein
MSRAAISRVTKLMPGPRGFSKLMAAVAGVVLVLAFALQSGPAGATGASSSVPAIVWHQCPANSAAAMAGGFVCAAVTAPLDYRNPTGAKIKLAVVKHQATGPRRRGVIFVNPGGPGLPGTEAIPAELSLFPKPEFRSWWAFGGLFRTGCPVFAGFRGWREPKSVGTHLVTWG